MLKSSSFRSLASFFSKVKPQQAKVSTESLSANLNSSEFIPTPDHFKFVSKFASYVHHGIDRKATVSSLMDLTDSTSKLALLPRRRLYGNPYETISVKSGDDAMILSPNLIGVADGVSGWEKGHANSGLFARSFLENISKNFTELTFKNSRNLSLISNKDLSKKLDDSFYESLEIMHHQEFKGSSTLVAGMIIDKNLKIISIGDSKIFIIRDGEIIGTNQEQYFANLCPQQVGTQENCKLPSEIVEYFDLELKKDDLILICSDGVTDNLYPDEILKLINDTVNKDKTNLQQVCNKLLITVKQTAFDNYCVTPYVEKVNEMSSSFITGGKLDDTSICISKVVLNE